MKVVAIANGGRYDKNRRNNKSLESRMIRLAPPSSRSFSAGRLTIALAFSLGLTAAALAQTPPASPTTPAPAATPAPATPPAAATPAPSSPASATPAPSDPAPAAQPPASPPAAQAPASPAPAAQAPASPPAAAQAPATPPPAVQAADPFGEELTLTTKQVVFMKGTANWDAAFDTITSTLKTLQAALDKQNIKAAGAPLIVYTSTDDTGFVFQAQIPVTEVPKAPLGKDISNGKSPEGKALKFVHRGSYDNMDNTYEAITNHLDEKKLEAKDSFIEEYVTDPLKTAEDKLIINVFVPLK
jgi:effector-binding domain-containing protein